MAIYLLNSIISISVVFTSIRLGICQQYREGYANNANSLPGSSGDTRNLASFPFSTDTNRYADGISSESAYSVTSPHFPLYNGSLTNITDRAKYYIKYIESAAIQGIGIYGDGDDFVEDAKYKIIKNRNYQEIPKPNLTFPVYAAIKWNPSGFAIQVGEYYRLDVAGLQYWNDGGIRVDANGYQSYYDAISNCHVAIGRCRSHLKSRRRLLTANWMSLSCAIGQFVRPLYQIIPGEEQNARYVPLDEAELQKSISSQ